jgi:hypothetical protein
VEISLPQKIQLHRFNISPGNDGDSTNLGKARFPKTISLHGYDGSSWSFLQEFTTSEVASLSEIQTFNITTPSGYYNSFVLTVKEIYSPNPQASSITSFDEWKLYGYEEDPPTGDTSVDTTFTSIMNTPQTTGANVYVDGSLGETFTNRVTGPTVSNTHTTYDATGKYWELNGSLESNIAVEANTFLSGDQPHAVSVWFNSSNLEANVSNTCVFSVSDQEKLDSVNLDLQSNTWHNLTYAYQGEGGSRVTYLDGRKVSEDQAEDTFGAYPPFAMTGYSQGGYVVSASSEFIETGALRYAYGAYDPSVDFTGAAGHVWMTKFGTFNPNAVGGDTFIDSDGGTHIGHWNKLELPYKLKPSYLYYKNTGTYTTERCASDWVILGSNDDTTWDLVHTSTTVLDTTLNIPINSTKAYKYLMFLCKTINSSTALYVQQLAYYGHRENDLVRLPDPTNVLKYPHIAMTGPAQRGYVATHGTSVFSSRVGYRVFSGNTNSSWETDNNAYDLTNNGVAQTGTATFGAYTGHWVKLELPHKIVVSGITLYSYLNNSNSADDRRPDAGAFLGSDNDSTWNLIHAFGSGSLTWTSPSTTNVNLRETNISSMSASNTNAYKYIVFVITHKAYSGVTITRSTINELELYGTEENSSIPIQIGGGNIDRVANFRVYDKFVGEDQALEIWDAQKDAFGRAKSSMTLHKGRLGIGTTEPEGRLAVADEPHNLEEFPPRAMTDNYKNYFEGHGEFCINASSYRTASWSNGLMDLFDKNNSTFIHNSNGSAAHEYSTSDGTYSGTASLGGYSGEWYTIKLPYRILINHFTLRSRGENSTDRFNQSPKDFTFVASNDGGRTWVSLSELVNQNLYASQSGTFNINTNVYYDYFGFIVHKIQGVDSSGNPDGTNALTIAEWRLFGTREQGQSVLHDGQLTLTKNLTVPRIGPALDADDTPRRDRLVVEYNTSTNPTFEGAVRDMSGRGNDGILYGNTYYDATTKALVFDGLGADYIFTGNLQNSGGDIDFTISMWIKPDVVNSTRQSPFLLGEEVTNKAVGLNFISTDVDFFVVGGVAYTLAPTTGVFDIGLWRHFILYRRGGLMGVYVNGVYITPSVTGSGSLDLPQTTQITLGNRDGQNYFNGSISNFKLYDVALTASEVKTLYDMGRCDEGHHVVNFSKTRVGIGLGDGEAPRGALDVRGGNVVFNPQYESGTSSGRVGIGTSSPNSNFNVHQGTVSGSGAVPFSHGFSLTAYNPTGTVENVFALYINNNNDLVLGAGYDYDGNLSGTVGYFTDQVTDVKLNNFTGQHRTFIKDVPFSQVGDLEGLIVSSDQNKYIKMSGGIEAGSNAITTNESLPVVSLSTTTNDKKCFGVISASEDPEERSDAFGNFVTPYEKEKGDTRVYINSVGEGAIWVSNIGGSLEAGDYITTSNVAGYGQKQESDSLKNYTVAKITMDCDFEPATQPVQQILRSNVVETYYLGNVHKVKNVPHEFVTTVVGADDAWSNVSISPSDTTYAEWSNLEANTQNTYTLTYTQTSNVVYDTKYTLTTTANVTESDAWDKVFVDPPTVTYAEWSNLEANTQNTYTLTYTQTTTDEKTPDEWSTLESNVQSLYNKVYYQSVEEEVAATWPGAVAHTRVTDVIENELDEHGQIQWEDHPTDTEKAYKIRYLDASGVETDSANAVHIAAFVGCTYHCG